MRVRKSVVGRNVSFFHPNQNNKMILVRGKVQRFLGDGIVINGKSFWFADMVALRKH